MKRLIAIFLTAELMLILPYKLFSQSTSNMQEFGITTGEFTNFPANQHYLKETMTMFYLVPYIREGRHEFSAGILYPLTNKGLYFTDNNINPRPGAVACYKFYIFNVFGRENLFVHYTFQYLRFGGHYDKYYTGSMKQDRWSETDMYINNVFGFGYNLFIDTDERFGFYYILDWVISQAGYKLGSPGSGDNSWNTRYIWNNLSTHLGLSFKLTSLKKKDKK